MHSISTRSQKVRHADEQKKTGMNSGGVDAAELFRLVKLRPVPKHVAIIMDGNGRWAQRRGLPRIAGHSQGISSLKETVRAAAEIGIQVLTVFAFSTENWSRPRSEVNFLMTLLEDVLEREIDELHANNVSVRAIGRLEELPPSVKGRLDKSIALTSANSGLILNIALNYGGRAELVDAMKTIATKVKNGDLEPDQIDESVLQSSLYTRDLPEPDLLIRTGGEFRISNFLLWEIAYSEIWITPVCWPDFGRIEFLQAICDYQRRERRYGRIRGDSHYDSSDD